MSQATLAARPRARTAPRFYVWMSGACLLIAVLGFMPTYFLPLAHGTFTAEPVVHIHGVILFSWVIFLFTQSLLVASGRTIAHRSWGMLGIAIATALVFIVTTVVSLRISQVSQPGQPPALAHDVRAFEWPIISELLFFIPVFTLAIVKVRRPETHKRLLLLATITMLGAPVGRLFGLLFAPPPDPNPAVIQVPPVFVLIPPALIADLLILVAIAYDWRTRGRPHPVWLIGGAVSLLLILTAVPVSGSDTWQTIATALGHLAG